MTDRIINISLTKDEAARLWDLLARWRIKGPITDGADLNLAANIQEQINQQGQKTD